MINFMIFKEFVFKFFINFAFGVICVVFIFNCLVIIVWISLNKVIIKIFLFCKN